VLLVDLTAPTVDTEAFQREYGLEPLPLTGEYFTDRSQEIGMAEVMVGADSTLVGKTVAESDVRDRFGLSVIGLRRGQAPVPGRPRDERLQIGDTLLVSGPWKSIERLRNDATDLLLLNTCSIREKAQEKVYSQLGLWRQLKSARPGLIIGVGGCVASQEGEDLTARAPFVDLVFGPQTLHRLPLRLGRHRRGVRFQGLAHPLEHLLGLRPDLVEMGLQRARLLHFGVDARVALDQMALVQAREPVPQIHW